MSSISSPGSWYYAIGERHLIRLFPLNSCLPPTGHDDRPMYCGDAVDEFGHNGFLTIRNSI